MYRDDAQVAVVRVGQHQGIPVPLQDLVYCKICQTT